MALNTNAHPHRPEADALGASGAPARPDALAAPGYGGEDDRFAALEAAARAAISTVTIAGEQRLAAAVDRAETRVMDALAVVEQTRGEVARWRAGLEDDLNRRLREIGEWDDALTEMRNDVLGLRELAEAALGVASDDLERRWDAVRRDLADQIATAESDERARWEAFMSGATETLASSAGIDPAEVDALRAEITRLSATAGETTDRLRLAQREQLAALRTELRALVESERGQTVADVEQRIAEARRVFTAQAEALRAWQARVGDDVLALRATAEDAEQRVSATAELLRADAQAALGTIRAEVERGVAQAQAAARDEIGAAQSATQRHLRAVRRRATIWPILALIVALLALAAGGAALAAPWLHLPI